MDLLESEEPLKAVSIGEGGDAAALGVLGLNINETKGLIKELTRKKSTLAPNVSRAAGGSSVSSHNSGPTRWPLDGMRVSKADASHRRGATRAVSGVVHTPPANRLYRDLRLDGWRRTGGGCGRHLSQSSQEKIRKKPQNTPTQIARSSLTLSEHVAADASRPLMDYAWPPFLLKSQLFNPLTFETEIHACQVDKMMQQAESLGQNSTCKVFRS